jgi:acyl-CoA synthetase (AMP-forming)/AMP-acid ligase II
MDWLIERFQSAPAHTAFIHEGREVSYGAVVASVEDFHGRVQAAGIERGQTVVVLGDYSPEVFCMILALCRNGSIVIPLTRTSVVEESVALAVSGCDWYVEFDLAGMDATITHRGLASDNALLAEFRQRGTPGMVLFSSGSTGKPKGILHDFNQVAEKFRKQRAPVVAIPFLMIDHFGGINTILAITSSLGTVVTVADRSVPNICAAIEKYKVELLPATPSFLTLMMASNLHHQYDLSSLKRITYGTEVMPQSTLDRVRAAFPGVDMLQTYGLSEVGVLRSQSRGDGSLWVRVGGEGFQTKVVDGAVDQVAVRDGRLPERAVGVRCGRLVQHAGPGGGGWRLLPHPWPRDGPDQRRGAEGVSVGGGERDSGSGQRAGRGGVRREACAAG